MKFILKTLLWVSGLLSAGLPGICQVTSVDRICLTVSNLDKSVRFYEQALGFKKIWEKEYSGASYENLWGVFGLRARGAGMRLGGETIELIDFLTSGGRHIPEDTKSNDLIFQHLAIVVSDMETAYRRLQHFGIEQVSTSPQTLPLSNPVAAGIKAFYFHDPDGHTLELIYFPKGKGQPKWQKSSGQLFLGVDHSAIAVTNTDSSLQFYREVLGLEKKGESWNSGTEQAHLNFVEGARLHITGLKPIAGPGIEFLEYLTPGPGKSIPLDSKADDLWYWQPVIQVKNAREIYDRMKQQSRWLVSKTFTLLDEGIGRARGAFVVRDRDGHALLIRDEVPQPIASGH